MSRKPKRLRQCPWVLPYDGGHNNCKHLTGHAGPHRTHGGSEGGDDWVKGKLIPFPRTIKARVVWVNPNLPAPPPSPSTGDE